MNDANLELSKNEYTLVINSDFILTKNRIIEKIVMLFGALSENYKMVLPKYADRLSNEIFINAPKIYRGEQYKNLPYVMLDYPRCFSKTDVFAIRSFFWWGNYFSITLHLSGKYLKMYGDVIFQSTKNKNKDWYLSVNENEWEHHFENNNYKLIEVISDSDIINFKEKRFMKIAKKLSLENWQQAELFFEQQYESLLKLICADQLPNL